ncbi:MAG TPA: hypothetical protein VLE27_13145 [Thermoanaerobaculia bacterium]|nr:hypothetical protein [Thermoanaerobaculia bacterium]
MGQEHDASARGYARHPRWWKDQLGSYYLSDISPRLIDDCRLDGVEVVVDKSIRGKASAAAGAVVAPRKSRRMKEVMARITS